MTAPLVMAVTGASGAIYAARLLELLIAGGRDVHLTISPSAQIVFREELGVTLDLESFSVETFTAATRDVERWGPFARPDEASVPGRVFHHSHRDFMAPIASGSFLTGGMVICPCSGGTLSGVVRASSSNLIERAAEVHLKERRKLILVPRETPLSTVQLENMLKASQVGAVVLPAMPGWYHGVNQLADLVDFVVARILDQLEVPCGWMNRWGTGESHA